MANKKSPKTEYKVKVSCTNCGYDSFEIIGWRGWKYGRCDYVISVPYGEPLNWEDVEKNEVCPECGCSGFVKKKE